MRQVDETQQTSHAREEKPQAPMAPRWAAAVAILAFGILYAALPDRVTIGPNWLLLAFEVVLLIPLLLSGIAQRPLRNRTIRTLIFVLLAGVTAALIGGIILFVVTLPNRGANEAKDLLRTAALLWISNVLVFAFWYWEIDGGGPRKRLEHGHQAADFMFPQQVNGNDGSWAPHFFDYLFVGFTGATALSPTDTYPLTRRAKGLMMVEALNAMVILAIIVGRIVNIL
ncbi:MAG: hypothetical protein JO215_09230 [Ktedonobacteraceae bacterium]|nr:hypothetical protein [Ktedonobacteraceae bacterium]MBV9615732.1 hypothetical protein [Ktedonobacteraceae bacterium]MBV9712976.1 hypothetical protein [Ktedonobacteraceae bacterium]